MTLTASRSFLAFDLFRIPYTVEPDDARASPLQRVGPRNGAGVYWPTALQGVPRALGDITIASPVLSVDDAETLLGRTPQRWRRDGDFWLDGDGNVFLPFDPDDAIVALLKEAYVDAGRGGALSHALAVARSTYYRVRPLLPRQVQIAMRRRFTRVQEKAAFPRWPIETSLHDLYALLLRLVDERLDDPAPRLAPWPHGHGWAFVLTHDVEGQLGYDHIDRVLDAEKERGLRSAWYFVPERDYRVEEERLAALEVDGFEVGVHGLRHDGRDLSAGVFESRLPSIRKYADRWGASGFRSPATHRSWELMPRLGFDYDTSFSDVARYEPQAGGSCSWLPFFIDDLVELPITLPMDHTLFELLGRSDGRAWAEKARFLRRRGGMALLLTHPDYLLEEDRLRAYTDFLDEFAEDTTAWRALPRDVTAWWRRRAASSIERSDDGWRVVGPAAGEARIESGSLQ
jgi:peptidoglycan/xylan/chitin deacetylase (PgdA/CDA1 family)